MLTKVLFKTYLLSSLSISPFNLACACLSHSSKMAFLKNVSLVEASSPFHHFLPSSKHILSTQLPFIESIHSDLYSGPFDNQNFYPNQISNSSKTRLSAKKTDDDNNFYKNLLLIISYSLIIFISLCGNTLVLRVIASEKKIQTTTNLLIALLAFADVLTTTLNLPFNVARFILYNYPFGKLLCKLVPFVQVMCVYVSTFTMGLIAIHRYITLSYPHKLYNTTSGLKANANANQSLLSGRWRLGFIIIIVWITAGILAVPHSMFNQIEYVKYKNESYARCRADYPKFKKFNLRFWLSFEAFLTQYLIPLSITCILYIKIGFVVSKQGRLASSNNNQQQRKKRRLIMLALVVLVFGITYAPLNIYHLLVDFHVLKYNFDVFLICHWFAMTSVCYNPFIYCWLNDIFRKGAFKMLSFACFCCSKTSVQPDSMHQNLKKDISFAPLEIVHSASTANDSTKLTTFSRDNHDHLQRQERNFQIIMEDHLEGYCPKAHKTAISCQKEKRKFRKLRLSSFRHKQKNNKNKNKIQKEQSKNSNNNNNHNQLHQHFHHYQQHNFNHFNDDWLCNKELNPCSSLKYNTIDSARMERSAIVGIPKSNNDIPVDGVSRWVANNSSIESIVTSVNSFNSNCTHKNGCNSDTKKEPTRSNLNLELTNSANISIRSTFV